jgi:hypothetical protein
MNIQYRSSKQRHKVNVDASCSANQTKKHVLIVGDSFIDENWLMSRADIYHSYNVGREHYISNLLNANSCILSYCGAASIFRILQGPRVTDNSHSPQANKIRSRMESLYNLVALSAWNPADDSLLRCLLCNQLESLTGVTPYRISGLSAPSKCDGKERLCPKTNKPCHYNPNINNLVKANVPGAWDKTSSNRLIRLYEGYGSDQPRLQSRYDWRIELEDKYKNYDIIRHIETHIGIDSVLAIVVLDHGYGVIDAKLVGQLLETFPSAGWYLRCKLEDTDWIKVLSNAQAENKAKKKVKKKAGPRIRLIFRDEQLLEYKYGVRTWRYDKAILGRGALEVLGNLLGIETYTDTISNPPTNHLRVDNAALLFDDDTAIAATRIGEKEDAVLVNIASAPGDHQPIRVGRSSVYFASLIFWDLYRRKEKADAPLDNELEEACKWALDNSYNCSVLCSKAWLNQEASDLSGKLEWAVYRDAGVCDSERIDQKRKAPLYKDYWKEWNKSSQELGIIDVKDGLEIQLWRAQMWRDNNHTYDYVCPGGPKRTDINGLIKRLKLYIAKDKPRYPFNCLFLAEPGWGKSRLAKCLAHNHQLVFQNYSIAQMGTNQDLKQCLKEVVSLQNRGKRVLVFIDEIDANIESHDAMGLLLGPIWDGYFVSDGNAYRIEPCVWVFASSKSLNKLRSTTKGRDFLSRINGPIIDLDFLARLRENMDDVDGERQRIDQMADIFRCDNLRNESLRSEDETRIKSLRTELVYHGVNFVNQMYGPISFIDKSVLEIFYNTMPIDGIRSVEIFVSLFRDVHGGIVTLQNIPDMDEYPELKRHLFQIKRPSESSDMVKVIVNPPYE